MGWIVTSPRPGRERLIAVTQAALTDLQNAIIQTTSSKWPCQDDSGPPPEPHTGIVGDYLRLWYGPSRAPVIDVKPRILLNSVLYE